MDIDYNLNNDASIYAIKRDSLGRRRHPNQNIGAKKIYRTITVRIDFETYQQLKKKARDKMGQKIRDYIEWGLENDK